MKHKDIILQLRAEGKTYNEIKEITGASKGTISYHCGADQKEKTAKRRDRFIKTKHPIYRKIGDFTSSKCKQPEETLPETCLDKLLYLKIYSFQNPIRKKVGRYMNFSVKDVLDILGDNPKCYLTGVPIDLNDTKSYNFDHKIPSSRGGPNTLNNLGVCTKDVNQAKSDKTVEEFIDLCKQVLIHNGYTVSYTE